MSRWVTCALLQQRSNVWEVEGGGERSSGLVLGLGLAEEVQGLEQVEDGLLHKA